MRRTILLVDRMLLVLLQRLRIVEGGDQPHVHRRRQFIAVDRDLVAALTLDESRRPRQRISKVAASAASCSSHITTCRVTATFQCVGFSTKSWRSRCRPGLPGFSGI